MSDKAYLNGRFVDSEKATVSIFDRGLNYGDGLFETMKASYGKVLFFEEHIERLFRSTERLAIESPLFKELGRIDDKGPIAKLIKKNGLTGKEAYVKILVTRGTSRPEHGVPLGLEATVIITTGELKSTAIASRMKRGVSGIFFEGHGPGGNKSLNFLSCVLARKEAQRRRVYEAILTTPGGELLEGSSSNIFIYKKGELRTPPLDGAILPGVTRATLLGIARNESIDIREEALKKSDLSGAKEAFITNSLIDIVPLVRIDANPIGTGRPGRVTRLLQKAYRNAL